MPKLTTKMSKREINKNADQLLNRIMEEFAIVVTKMNETEIHQKKVYRLLEHYQHLFTPGQ